MSNYIETAFMQQRTDFMKTLPDRRKRFSIPDGVDMYLDIEYVNDQNEAHRLDVFRPSESPDKELPIIFNVHGGGLIMGCKEFNRYFCARLSNLAMSCLASNTVSSQNIPSIISARISFRRCGMFKTTVIFIMVKLTRSMVSETAGEPCY